jgi:hypothetical protein
MHRVAERACFTAPQCHGSGDANRAWDFRLACSFWRCIRKIQILRVTHQNLEPLRRCRMSIANFVPPSFAKLASRNSLDDGRGGSENQLGRLILILRTVSASRDIPSSCYDGVIQGHAVS